MNSELESIFGSYYKPSDYAEKLPDNTDYLREHNIFLHGSDDERKISNSFKSKIAEGETIYLVGLNLGHNSGVSLIEASEKNGIQILANYEEERFSAIKHVAGYPELSIKELKKLLVKLGKSVTDIFCINYAWNSVKEEKYGQQMYLLNGKSIRNNYFAHINVEATMPPLKDEDKNSTTLGHNKKKNLYWHSPSVISAMQRIRMDWGLEHSLSCVQMSHHDNHAYFSYGVSPFYSELGKQTMISCIDGGGDVSSSSLYLADGLNLEVIKRIPREHSLGFFYMLCSSFWGGWTALSAEGRYMGAAAWGDNNRLTNPYYKQLRQYFIFLGDGDVFVNTALTENAYSLLQELIGPFLNVEDLWNPDACLNVDDIQHSAITQRRVDTAAAVQMVFEDALFHIVEHLILTTKSDQLVLCGGTALNCVASMRLLEHFDENFYRQHVGKETRLKIWVPPIPSDQGVVVGAAYQFAMRNGVTPQASLPTPFLCGLPPTSNDIQAALDASDFVLFDRLGNLNDSETKANLADWMAYIISENGVIGVFQGAAETGPRALGHRSILSNPCNPDILEVLNSRVKLRERIRPLAPMMTLKEAKKWFHLSEGASANDYDAYHYMVLTVQARNEARSVIPAVIHQDGSSRIQIVQARNNDLIHAYLTSLHKYIGVEVSINTSLNVGTPIVQTPTQAIQIFKRTKGLDCIFMVGEEGDVFMVWAKENVQQYESRIPQIAKSYWSKKGV